MFELHPQLKRDCIRIGRFPLCHLLLMNDANFPWFILVPDRVAVTEIYQLTVEDQRQLVFESSNLGQLLMEYFNGDKLNIGALGNMVPQLHLHHIVRYRQDPAWPAPVWGRVPATSYKEEEIEKLALELSSHLVSRLAFESV